MKCKFCNEKMEEPFALLAHCHKHEPIKVKYQLTRTHDVWTISHNNYSLIFSNNQTFLCKKYPDSPISKLIKKIDYDLKITPEQFDSKIKTMLSFL